MSIQKLWATPIYRANINDDALIQAIVNEVMCDPDASSNNACEISRDKACKKIAENDGVFSVAVQYMYKAVEEYLQEAYGVINAEYHIDPFYLLHHQGGSVQYHNHPGSSFTGILYVSVPSGHVSLLDPRVNANRGMMPAVQDMGHFKPVDILPVAGDIIIFPSYVYHLGTPNLVRQPRIVMPFDVNAVFDE
jgi:uncharacterized protein (TIGR02466 family)